MKLIFCADPLHRSEPDEMYQSEASTVASLGYTFSLIDYEALVNDKDPIKATRCHGALKTGHLRAVQKRPL